MMPLRLAVRHRCKLSRKQFCFSGRRWRHRHALHGPSALSARWMKSQQVSRRSRRDISSSFLFIGVKRRSLLFRHLGIEVGVENVCTGIHMQILGYRFSMSEYVLSAISKVPVKAGP